MSAKRRAVIESEAIDAVLCDIRMPGESGLEFAAWLAAERPAVRVVLLSAFRKFEYAQEAFRYGVRGYLVKPPSDEEFRSIFRAVAKELDSEREVMSDEAQASRLPGSPDRILADVLTYLRGNIGDACLKAAARAAGMNPTYFSTWFREKSGAAFSDTVATMRMDKAARLIVDKGMRVGDVSVELGYSSPKNFSRAFRRHFGASPKAYKRFTAESRQG